MFSTQFNIIVVNWHYEFENSKNNNDKQNKHALRKQQQQDQLSLHLTKI